MKIEATTLQEAITKASEKLECSVVDLKIDVLQRPSGGIFGLFKKNAIIKVSIENSNKKQSKIKEQKNNTSKKEAFKNKKQEENVIKEKLTKKDDYTNDIKNDSNKRNSKKDRVDVDLVLTQIENDIKKLFSNSFFDIKTVQVNKFDEKTVYIKLDGEDAALLIGKEGARYKAISTLLYNYLNLKYGLYIRLEIAEFYSNQEKMIAKYLEEIFTKVQKNGKAQTRPLDGILIKIALEQLREKYPEKYVGVRSSKHGKFIIINDKNKK